MEEIIKTVTNIICDVTGVDCGNVNIEDDLQEKYNIPSVDIIQILIKLEKEFKIEFEESDLILDNFRNINSMSVLVERKVNNDKG